MAAEVDWWMESYPRSRGATAEPHSCIIDGGKAVYEGNAGRSSVVEREKVKKLFGNFGERAIGWWAWAGRVLGLLRAIVVV